MGLRDEYNKILSKLNSVTSNPILENIDLDILNKIDNQSSTNEYLNKILSSMTHLLPKLTFEHSEPNQRFYTELYSEAKLFFLLHDIFCKKENFSIEKLNEGDINKPDFKLTYNDITFFIELKTPIAVHGKYNYDNITENGIEAKVDLESQIYDKNKRVAIVEQEYAPYNDGSKKYDCRSRRIVIETIIVTTQPL